MLRYFCFIVVSFFIFTGCVIKNNVQTLQSQELKIEQNEKSLKLNIINKTDEPIYIQYDIQKALEKKGYLFVDNKESTILDLTIVYANIIDKKSSLGQIMQDINVNIGLGTHSGNVSLYTSIGSTIGRLLGNNLDARFYQVVVDISVTQPLNPIKNTQWIITAPMDGLEKRAVIYAIEEEIVQRTMALFE